jgi:hypothetical protein
VTSGTRFDHESQRLATYFAMPRASKNARLRRCSNSASGNLGLRAWLAIARAYDFQADLAAPLARAIDH